MERVPMTREGHDALLAEVKALKEERPKISERIGIAADHGDLKENAEYHAEREKLGMVEGRIQDIEGLLGTAEIIDLSGQGGDTVRFGAYVTLEDIDSGKEIRYRVVGPGEADTDKGSISVSSPVARAIVGKSVGDEVKVKVPSGIRNYEISDVQWSK